MLNSYLRTFNQQDSLRRPNPSSTNNGPIPLLLTVGIYTPRVF